MRPRHISGSWSPSTFQVRLAGRSLQPLELNGVSNPHGLQKPTRPSYSNVWETMGKLGSEKLSHRHCTISSLPLCLAQHPNELLVGWCCRVGPPRFILVDNATLHVCTLNRQN